MGRFANLAFTPAVKAVQARLGSRRAYARLDGATTPDAIGEDEAAFIQARDSFYLASVGETGWPYVQHRGGRKGFVKVLDEHTLGFADLRGNRQYVSVGNVERDDRVALLFMDYPNRARLKVLARAKIVTRDSDPDRLAKLVDDDTRDRVERGFVLAVEGFDWNCPQYITPRFTEEEIEAALAPMVARLESLEAENRELRARLAERRHDR
jgi:predicted pyridoxine 5'-phosphate oxidase superfamily flavin-nucleotide-binding protein